MENDEFHTQKGYYLKENRDITLAMEDYLEMIYRLCQDEGFVRISNIAKQLNVTTSSASKMMTNLKNSELIHYEKYGIITLTQKGIALGEYLLYRHDLLNRFFCMINGSDNELEQVEQIEHYINRETVENIEKLMSKLSDPKA